MSGSTHDRATTYLLHHPHVLGIEEHVHWSAREVNVYRPGGKDLETQVDLLFKTSAGIYVVEFKASDNHRPRALAQLKSAEDFVKREFKENPYSIFARGHDFTYEIIRGKIR